ncbi:cleavage and polyadenylation specificity factor subunit 1-like [Lingula anatina]|uniref:Cleavage and polyadenylation specificity factor subunit 1 n=1 Tax=Lingula anatina TaxID=7574 RepID=A0A2R2MN31_LINAN|nr:cleavage and polyadenylation specificity factor subunit 1-like [Lingula anatina]|eukprot:XP_023931604.1 cleavage and polyadenylation specificity factor subunit 1-like [Lingula anatina]
MYSIYKQTQPPTGIEHCVYCNFFSTKEKNLIIAGSTQLHVYRLNADIEGTGKGSEKVSDNKQKRMKLETLGSFSLFGNVMSLATVRLPGAVRDSLLLSFQDAKLSVVDYDASTHSLKTSSLHYFEEEELKHGFQQQQHYIPMIRVDPDGRCASMVIYGTHIVILPFRRESAAEDADGLGGSSAKLSSYIIDASKLDEKICNIIDIQFLHGYYEPTMFILYEPLRTWTGRIAVRQDTCCIVAISLNMQQKVHPIIWSLSNLPYDCFQVQAVPKPIGGVLVFAVNSLLYLNQSVPPYGVSLNITTDICTGFPLKPQEGMKIMLDCMQTTFIDSERLVLSLKGGEINFEFQMCQCEEGYLFLGSRLGNSLLLKYTEKAPDFGIPEPKPPDREKQDDLVQPAKKKRLDTMGDWMATDVSAIDDLDDLEVYGSSETQAGTQITSYTFEVCDSIMNIGPCGQIVMGEPAFLSEEFSNSPDPDVELVTTSGYGKNGALSVLQRSIRPQVVTTFELPGCYDMWTVIGPPGGSSGEKTEDTEVKEAEATETTETTETAEEDKKEEEVHLEDQEHSHAFLILSRDDSTMILQTGQEIMELDHSGFSTQAPTVYAGNMGENKYILQVSPKGVRLLEGVKQLQHIPIDVGSPLVQCSVADPFAVIISEEGHVMLLNLRQDSFGSGVRLAVIRPNLQQKSKVLKVCTYRDISGMFVTSAQEEEEESAPVSSELKTPKAESSFSFDKSTIDDEDELLYGDTDAALFSPTAKVEIKSSTSGVEEAKKKEIKPSYWALLYRENGNLEFYSLPDFKQVFVIKSFPMGHKVLVDSAVMAESMVSEKQEKFDKGGELPSVKELLVVGLGNKCSRPYLMARIEEDLMIYEVFPYHQVSPEGHLKVRFRKIQHGLVLRPRKLKKKKGQAVVDEDVISDRVARLRIFTDISGYSGVFICGPSPHWLFVTPRGALRMHPMSIDGSVTCFAPFHNINCPKGFLYFNRNDELRISVLPTHLSYDAPWPVRKVPLRVTPHFIQYHVESKTYTVVTSAPEPCSTILKIKDEEKEFETQTRDERFILPMVDKFSLQLFSPVSWEAIPNTKIELEDFEHVTCLKTVNLKSEETVSGLKGYMAIGTNYCYGEEVTSRGRMLMFDIIEVVPEPGQPLTKNKLKTIYDKEQKGPVTAMCSAEGLLVTAIGQKVFIWTLKDNDLSGVAFIDTQIYIHQMTNIKGLILISDIMKSITVLRYQTDMKVLSLVSRDIKPLEVYSAEFLVDNTQLGFLVSDRDKNMILEMYQPEARESHGGQRLLRKADINIGHHVNTMFRIRCKVTDPSTDKRAPPAIEKKQVTYFATLDGGLGYMLPITEKMYRRLLMLQNALTVHIPHLAGLNPKAFRNLKVNSRMLANSQKNVLDGELIWMYINLGINERQEIARKLGTSPEQIFDDLTEIERITAHF